VAVYHRDRTLTSLRDDGKVIQLWVACVVVHLAVRHVDGISQTCMNTTISVCKNGWAYNCIVIPRTVSLLLSRAGEGNEFASPELLSARKTFATMRLVPEVKGKNSLRPPPPKLLHSPFQIHQDKKWRQEEAMGGEGTWRQNKKRRQEDGGEDTWRLEELLGVVGDVGVVFDRSTVCLEVHDIDLIEPATKRQLMNCKDRDNAISFCNLSVRCNDSEVCFQDVHSMLFGMVGGPGTVRSMAAWRPGLVLHTDWCS